MKKLVAAMGRRQREDHVVILDWQQVGLPASSQR